MFWRHELFTRILGFTDNEELQFLFNLPHQVSITLRRLREDELESGKPGYLRSGDSLCIITTEKNPPRKLREYFENPSTPAPPPQLEQFANEIRKELGDYGERTLRILRWRSGRSGHTIGVAGKLTWSQDHEHWHPLRYSIYPNVIWGAPEPKQIKKFEEPVVMMLQQEVKEPLGHELFREAWELMARNPRSAVILGIAAAEIGFKQCVGILVPEAKWLADNVPSPPLVNMLREYLPKLPARKAINGHVLPPPERWLDTLRTGATIRNDIVHGRTPKLAQEKLREILGTVRELLYLLDIYCGHEWAWERLEVESQRELLTRTQ